LQLAVNLAAVTDESHCILCKRPNKLTFAKHASVLYEHGAMKISFFLQQWPKNALSLSHCVKCDQQQQTYKKMMSSIMASISRKSSNKVPHNNSSHVPCWDTLS
jgi:Zn ribbon nucleic-acid-binding protein